MTDELTHRYAIEADLPFVINAWCESYGSGSPTTVHIPKSIFYRKHRGLALRLLNRPNKLKVACLIDDTAVIVGFIMARQRDDVFPAEFGNIIDYIYVKEHFRRMGVATAMVKDLGVDLTMASYTHQTYRSIMLAPKWRGLTYDPYLLFGDA